jgi:hypothetical protein
LEIGMATTMLKGQLVEHLGDSLTIIRIFNATEPDAFPHFH